MKATRPAAPSWEPPGLRFTRWCRHVWVYALLIGGSLVFMWPFVWMVLASVKLDRELFSDEYGTLPQQPVPHVHSPYVEERMWGKFQHQRLDDVRPALEAVVRADPGTWTPGIDDDAALPYLVRGVFRRLTQIAPYEWWSRPTEELTPLLLDLVTPQIIEQTRVALTRSVVLGRVTVRSYDLREAVLIAPDDVADTWTIEGTGSAHFVNEPAFAAEGPVLAYDFSSGDHIALTTTVTLPFPLDRLHRLQLFVRPDDSWHALDGTFEMNGRLYRAETNTTYASLWDTKWIAIRWQPRGPDDLTLKQKKWLVLEEIDQGPQYESRPQQIKIRLDLRQRGFVGAWWAKISRNYSEIFNHVPFARYVATSLFLVIVQVALTVLSCSLVAYSFARLHWPGRGACFLLMLATLMVPQQITMIPQFLIVRQLGWYNTLLPLWVPSIFANAFFVFLLYQFMKGIPQDLEDAARIDGCGTLRIYWNVVMPLVRPSLAVIGIFTFMGVWNDFMGPLIYLNDQRLFPLSLGLYALHIQNSTIGNNSMGLMMAGSFLMTLPVIILFFFAQRFFIQGVTLTGMKG